MNKYPKLKKFMKVFPKMRDFLLKIPPFFRAVQVEPRIDDDIYFRVGLCLSDSPIGGSPYSWQEAAEGACPTSLYH